MSKGTRQGVENGGITVVKITQLSLVVLGSLVSYIYVSNQSEDRSYMRSIAVNVEKIVSNTIVINEHLKNTDAMISVNAKNISRNEKRLETLHNESRVYWRK